LGKKIPPSTKAGAILNWAKKIPPPTFVGGGPRKVEKALNKNNTLSTVPKERFPIPPRHAR